MDYLYLVAQQLIASQVEYCEFYYSCKQNTLGL